MAFTYSTMNGIGSLYLDDKLGHNQKEINGPIIMRRGYSFKIPTQDWIKSIALHTTYQLPGISLNDYVPVFAGSTQTSFWIGSSKFEASENFMGRMSCIQYFTRAITPAEVHYFKKCHSAEMYQRPKCPENFLLIDDNCFKVNCLNSLMYVYLCFLTLLIL